MEIKGSLPYSQVNKLTPVLSQVHPVQNFPQYFLKNHSNIILPSSSRSFKCKWSLQFRFSYWNFVRFNLPSIFLRESKFDLLL